MPSGVALPFPFVVTPTEPLLVPDAPMPPEAEPFVETEAFELGPLPPPPPDKGAKAGGEEEDVLMLLFDGIREF